MTETSVNQDMDFAVLKDVVITLSDGTELNCKLNGTEYQSSTKIDESIFTSENLSNVTIDGVDQGAMHLIHTYPFQNGTRFALCPQTTAEKAMAKMQSTIEYLALMCDVELYEEEV